MNDMNDNNYDPNLDELFNDITNIVNNLNEQMHRRRIRCEQILEKLVSEEKVEILVDVRGFFHYRLTDSGKLVLQSEGYNIGKEETFIDPWRLA